MGRARGPSFEIRGGPAGRQIEHGAGAARHLLITGRRAKSHRHGRPRQGRPVTFSTPSPSSCSDALPQSQQDRPRQRHQRQEMSGRGRVRRRRPQLTRAPRHRPNLFEIMKDGEPVEALGDVRNMQAVFEATAMRAGQKAFRQIASSARALSLSAAERRDVVENILDVEACSAMEEVAENRLATADIEKKKRQRQGSARQRQGGARTAAQGGHCRRRQEDRRPRRPMLPRWRRGTVHYAPAALRRLRQSAATRLSARAAAR
jgi:hypothetical protein